jgi:hypothetical protein
MPYLLDLADACRKSGLTVVEDAGWRTRGHGPMGPVAGIVCHHTAGPATGDAPSLRVVRDGRPDLPGPLSNIVLGRSGTVYVVAAGLSYHAGVTFLPIEDNYSAVGIEGEATGVDAWPDVQMDAYVRLCRALCDHYCVSYDNVWGHKEVAKPLGRKIDPNFDMNAFRARIRGEDDLTPEEHNLLVNLVQKVEELHARVARIEPSWPGGVTDDQNRGYDLFMYAKRNNVELRQLSEIHVKNILDKISSLTVGGGQVDYKVLAKAVADEIYSRMAP